AGPGDRLDPGGTDRRPSMERRAFIGGGTAAIAAVATAACSGKGGSSGTAAGAAVTTTSDTATSGPAASGKGLKTVGAAAAADWAALAHALDGTLVRPGDASWATARQLYNTRFDSLKPAAVAYVA